MIKKILIGAGCVLGTAGITIGGTALIANNQGLAKFFKYPWGSVYFQQQEESKEKDALLLMYEDRINSLEKSVVDYERQLTLISSEKSQCLADISVLNAEIDRLKNQISELEASCEDKDSEIADLNSRITALNKQVVSLNSVIDAKNTEIAGLEIDLLQANNEITRLTGLIAGYEDIKLNAHDVVFYVGDVLVSATAVKDGETIESLPQDTNEYRIDSWKTADGQVFDTASAITDDITLYANITEKYAVTYMISDVEGNTTTEIEYTTADEFSLRSAPEFEDCEFAGWYSSADGLLHKNLDFELTGDITLRNQYIEWVDYAQYFQTESGSSDLEFLGSGYIPVSDIMDARITGSVSWNIAGGMQSYDFENAKLGDTYNGLYLPLVCIYHEHFGYYGLTYTFLIFAMDEGNEDYWVSNYSVTMQIAQYKFEY